MTFHLRSLRPLLLLVFLLVSIPSFSKEPEKSATDFITIEARVSNGIHTLTTVIAKNTNTAHPIRFTLKYGNGETRVWDVEPGQEIQVALNGGAQKAEDYKVVGARFIQ